jgi:hypothetical protein
MTALWRRVEFRVLLIAFNIVLNSMMAGSSPRVLSAGAQLRNRDTA